MAKPTINQEQVKYLSFNSISEAENATNLRDGMQCKIGKHWYYFVSNGGSYTVDGFNVLNTGDGGDTRWIRKKESVDNVLITYKQVAIGQPKHKFTIDANPSAPENGTYEQIGVDGNGMPYYQNENSIVIWFDYDHDYCWYTGNSYGDWGDYHSDTYGGPGAENVPWSSDLTWRGPGGWSQPTSQCWSEVPGELDEVLTLNQIEDIVKSDGSTVSGNPLSNDESGLVTKKYVDNLITTNTLTADNGLNITSNVVKLGGNLVDINTIIGLNGHFLTISGVGSSPFFQWGSTYFDGRVANANNATYYHKLRIDDAGLYFGLLESTGNGYKDYIQYTETEGFKIITEHNTNKGISYADDYSADNASNDRRLVDKGYVDNLVKLVTRFEETTLTADVSAGNVVYTVSAGKIDGSYIKVFVNGLLQKQADFSFNASTGEITTNIDLYNGDEFAVEYIAL